VTSAHRRDVTADVVQALVHDFAQPAASAALAIDLALLEFGQRRLEQVEHRLAVAAQQIEALQTLLRVYAAATPGSGHAAALGGSVTDPAAIVAQAVPGAVVGPCMPVAVPGDLLRIALERLASALGGDRVRCVASTARDRSGVLIRLSGRRGPPARVTPWVALLRCAGARVRLRGDSILISLRYSASLDRANGDNHVAV
jgi:hypothetical protein